MRPHWQGALSLALGLQAVAARLLQALPEDPYAFPKFRVTYLNGLPVLRDTADRWLRDGLRGGEPEFLDQHWKEGNARAHASLKGIGSGGSDGQEADDQVRTPLPYITCLCIY